MRLNGRCVLFSPESILGYQSTWAVSSNCKHSASVYFAFIHLIVREVDTLVQYVCQVITWLKIHVMPLELGNARDITRRRIEWSNTYLSRSQNEVGATTVSSWWICHRARTEIQTRASHKWHNSFLSTLPLHSQFHLFRWYCCLPKLVVVHCPF